MRRMSTAAAEEVSHYSFNYQTTGVQWSVFSRGNVLELIILTIRHRWIGGTSSYYSALQ